MPIKYRIDVLAELKVKGYPTTVLRRDKILGESAIQRLRHKQSVSYTVLARLCKMLDCQPGDILEYVPESSEDN